MVVAAGEFGRTSRVNEHVGRDHSTTAWSGLVAGAGVRGGQVIGATDSYAATVTDRPIAPGELVATIYDSLGLPLSTNWPSDAQTDLPLVEHTPIAELFS